MSPEERKTDDWIEKRMRGAYWGRKKAAKKESNRTRREMGKAELSMEVSHARK